MLKIFRKYKYTKGQTIVEYALLVTLVLAGVYVMSPYVIRSWNANVKGWEDSYTDSLQDPIGASPPGTFDVGCTEGYIEPCPSPPCCGFGTCLETQATSTYFCNPIGCCTPQPDLCPFDMSCCTTPVPREVPTFCGTGGCAADEVPADCLCGNEAPPPHFCECQFNRNCLFVCQNQPTAPFIEYAPAMCALDDLNLTANTNTTFVEEGKCSTPTGSQPKCQWECATTFVPGFSNTSCECPDGSINQGGVCVIDCTLSEGDCTVKVPAPLLPTPRGCFDLNYDDCVNVYGGACNWSVSLNSCREHTSCVEMRTNVALLFPPYPRCEFYPWCDWIGGGGYCCSAIQHNLCDVGLADATGCAAGQVLECCQFDTLGGCLSNTQACTLSADCCSNNCVGNPNTCCLPGQIGVCQGGADAGNCCAQNSDCSSNNCG